MRVFVVTISDCADEERVYMGPDMTLERVLESLRENVADPMYRHPGDLATTERLTIWEAKPVAEFTETEGRVTVSPL